jgi:putative DNA primase/helicase
MNAYPKVTAEMDRLISEKEALAYLLPMPPDEVNDNYELQIAYTKAAHAWPELQPLQAKLETMPYPTEALPPLIREAVQEVQAFVQAPTALIALTALSSVSLAVQTFYDVERAKSLHGPTGLFMLAIAESGERKSSCDGYFSKALRDHDAEQLEAAKPELAAFEASRSAWAAEKSGIESAIKREAKEGQDTSDLKRQLLAHQINEPKPPKVPRLVYGDATPEALIDGLSSWKSGGVMSAEAGAILGGHAMGDSAMRHLATLNVLWSGETIRQHRRGRGDVLIEGARLTIGLQVQESTLREFIKGTGDLARGTGFFARCLLAWPASTQGTRQFKQPTGFESLNHFNGRLRQILNRPVTADHDKAMIHLSEEAKAVWVAYYNDTEAALAEGGDLRDIRDIASKTADNAARIAALFHVFDGATGAIDGTTMENACDVAKWHLNESLRFFGQMSQPKNMSDAARLEEWALQYLKGTDTDKISTRDAQRLGPVRDKQDINAALEELADLGRARIIKAGRQKHIQIRREVLEGAP